MIAHTQSTSDSALMRVAECSSVCGCSILLDCEMGNPRDAAPLGPACRIAPSQWQA